MKTQHTLEQTAFNKINGYILVFVTFMLSYTINAQEVDLPAPSPFSKIEQRIGLTDITIAYSRPGAKGRVIFGELVPYGATWRTGANENTKITFSDDVMVNQQSLKAGSYALYSIPNQDSWDIIFYANTENWGTPQEWDDTKVALKTTVSALKKSEKIDWFTIAIDPSKDGSSAAIKISWENTSVLIPVAVPTKANAIANIEKALSGPYAYNYYLSAEYYYSSNEDIHQSKKWIDEAIKLSKEDVPYWYLRLQSLVYQKSGDKSSAIEMAKKAINAAESAGNTDYANSIKENLKEWGAL